MTHFLGLDVGSVSSNLVVVDGDGIVQLALYERNLGNPAAALARLLRQAAEAMPGERFARGVVAGSGKEMIGEALGIGRENEIVAHAFAAGTLHPQARSVIEIGGQDSKFIELGRDHAGQVVVSDHVFNDLCAAGTGAFLDQQAERLGYAIEDFARMAADARRPATVAGRCSVFAKSDMIHLQQAGRPTAEIAAGLCFAAARNYLGAMLKGRKPESVLLFQGGVAANPGMVRAFRELLALDESQLIVPEHHRVMGALGAALLARREGEAVALDPLVAARKVEGLQGLRRAQGRPKAGLRRAEGGGCGATACPGSQMVTASHIAAGRVAGQRLPAVSSEVAGEQVAGEQVETCAPSEAPVFLGLDIGSVSTKGVLLSDAGDVVARSYLPTRGLPLQAAAAVLAELRAAAPEVTVGGVGTTGSGRHLVGNVIGADVVRNEITAQAKGALFYAPDVDTVLEIGGQDAKFIRIEDGRLREFEMNRVCAAGTGAFLEEQAKRLGIEVATEFADLAFDADAPAPLGTRCTVFMDTDVVNHLNRGVPREDVVAGLAYSIAENYLEKVSAGRAIGKNVLFQGGVAANSAVVAAFRALLDRDVTVPPNHEVTGAIGAALIAREHRQNTAEPSAFKGFDVQIDDVKVKTFECRQCSNLCEINRVVVGDGPAAYQGSICGRYEQGELAVGPAQIRPDLPALLEEREKMLERFVQRVGHGSGERGRVGVPRALLFHQLYPAWHTVLIDLGFEVVLSPESDKHIVQKGIEHLPVETCLPIRAACGHVLELADSGLDRILVPGLKRVPDAASCKPSETDTSWYACPWVQSAPFILDQAVPIEVITPALTLSGDRRQRVAVAAELASLLGTDKAQAANALEHAAQELRRFDEAQRERGRNVLDWLETHPEVHGVVLIGKPYHIYDRYLNMDVGRRLRMLGMLPIPMGMLPLEDVELVDHLETLQWSSSRDMVRAAQFVASHRRLSSIVLTSFGCGPDAFTLPHVDDILRARHHLTLEFDEQRAGAGLVTRLEAFAEGVRADASMEPVTTAPTVPVRRSNTLRGKTVYLHLFADHIHAVAGALRRVGVDARLLPLPDEDTLRVGKLHTSGGECHAYVLFAGDLMKLVQAGIAAPENTVYHIATYKGPCLAPMYPASLQRLAEQVGHPQMQCRDVTAAAAIEELGIPYVLALGRGLHGIDRLLRLKTDIRAYAADPDACDRIYEECLTEIEHALADGDVVATLKRSVERLMALPRVERAYRARIGVVGDIYTRINRFANDNLPERLQELGCEVWMPSTLVDVVIYDLWYDSQALMRQGKLVSAMVDWVKSRFFLAVKGRIDKVFDPIQGSLLEESGRTSWERAAEYIDPDIDKVLTLNVARTAQLLDAGADGVINAMCHNCLLGKISSSVFEKMRVDKGGAPIMDLTYDGLAATSRQSRLEAFVHQAAERRRIEV